MPRVRLPRPDQLGGNDDFESITRAAAQALHARLRKPPGSANYVLCVLGSLYTRIIDDWALSDMRHPTAGVMRFKINTSERFLTPEKRHGIHDATEAGLRTPTSRKGHLEPRGVWALQLLALTGLRRSEIGDRDDQWAGIAPRRCPPLPKRQARRAPPHRGWHLLGHAAEGLSRRSQG